jgi:hypothetical protein
VPIRPLQLYADGGYQLRIRRLEGTPNYGPRQSTHSINQPLVQYRKTSKEGCHPSSEQLKKTKTCHQQRKNEK